ncbi:nicotinamide mononucleotide deamidase-related protein [Stygiolobus caldivivus]|uniref:Protein KN1_26060 n=1 Tax=Stygiolobus caldivivus TaxID=2824673 RepID=A0A8D5ZJ85_9CREN|nr:nicotinamide mononucleotide deamidase-related protein [Stygiolobus caldivivus]BCU71309.1 competence protein ComA [Stygiolobus caldivivus]
MEEWYAEIITIGNEILSGKTINTNASHIARRLISIGFTIRRITVVMDELEEIKEIFKETISRNPNLIVSTGGLGPTYDDKTSEGISLAINRPLELNQKAYQMIVEKYSRLGIQLTEERVKMAKMPRGSIAVENDVGIAPGIYVKYEDIEILATPGVPREMENVLENFLSKHLTNRPNKKYHEESFIIRGVMESTIAPYVKQLVKKYDLYIKTHPKGKELENPVLEIQIAGSSISEDEIERKIKECKKELIDIGVRLGGLVEEVK